MSRSMAGRVPREWSVSPPSPTTTTQWEISR